MIIIWHAMILMSMLAFLTTGIIFGLTAGISPGPLLTLVITQTLKHNMKEGIKVALVPVLSDAPLILISILVISKLTHSHILLGLISLAGAVFVGYLAYESIMFKRFSLDTPHAAPQSFKKGIITNILSPHPYIFWFSVGGPIVLKAAAASILAAILFISSFYFCLIGSKIAAALITARSRNFLSSTGYVLTIKILGVILLLFALRFLYDAFLFLDINFQTVLS